MQIHAISYKFMKIPRMDPTDAVGTLCAVLAHRLKHSSVAQQSHAQLDFSLVVTVREALLGASDFFFGLAVPFSAGMGLDAWPTKEEVFPFLSHQGGV